MKKFILSLSMILCVSLIWAQDTKPVTGVTPVVKAEVPSKEGAIEVVTPVDGPLMKLESTVVNFGTIEQNSDPMRSVNFTNDGTAPLVISNAKGSCGCTVPTWPREPIMPGESAKIDIRYDTKRVGPINKTVKLTTNDATGTYTLRVKGLVEAVVQENLPDKKSIFDKPGSGK